MRQKSSLGLFPCSRRCSRRFRPLVAINSITSLGAFQLQQLRPSFILSVVVFTSARVCLLLLIQLVLKFHKPAGLVMLISLSMDCFSFMAGNECYRLPYKSQCNLLPWRRTRRLVGRSSSWDDVISFIQGRSGARQAVRWTDTHRGFPVDRPHSPPLSPCAAASCPSSSSSSSFSLFCLVSSHFLLDDLSFCLSHYVNIQIVILQSVDFILM